jgi:hypothetical protein
LRTVLRLSPARIQRRVHSASRETGGEQPQVRPVHPR